MFTMGIKNFYSKKKYNKKFNNRLNLMIEFWRESEDEKEYWKNRALKAEELNQRLFEQCKKLLK